MDIDDQKKASDIPRFRKPSIFTRLFQIAILCAIIYGLYWAGLHYGILPETMRLF